jgi:predicted MFS family arabinose efflux permease
MAVVLGLLPRIAAAENNERVSYGDVLRMPGALVGYGATFAYMIGFYQTYTFIGDHVRNLHDTGAWLAGAITLSYGLGFGGGVIFDTWIDARGPRRVMALGLVLVGLNYLALPYATQSVAATVTYPVLWGLANHLCMTAIVSFLGSLSAARRGTIMGLFSFVTYVALAAGGALYGSVYDAYGFFAVSFAATATLWIAALAVQTLLDRKKA